MEQIPSSQNERPPLTQEECRKIAEDIYAGHEKELLEHQYEPVDGDTWWAASDRGVIDNHLEQFSPEMLHGYWGHGITRGDHIDRLTAAISMLSDNAMRGDTAPLANSGYVDAYTNGDFLAVSHKGERLMELGDDQKPISISLGKNPYTGEDIEAVKIKPGAVVVNAWYYPIVPELRAMFPGANILYANELPEYIKEEERH
jgi:hypothetical protein